LGNKNIVFIPIVKNNIVIFNFNQKPALKKLYQITFSKKVKSKTCIKKVKYNLLHIFSFETPNIKTLIMGVSNEKICKL
jgi:hypothetical protein